MKFSITFVHLSVSPFELNPFSALLILQVSVWFIHMKDCCVLVGYSFYYMSLSVSSNFICSDSVLSYVDIATTSLPL